jgi:hypothetical protein
MGEIETIRRELHVRRRTWVHISAATGITPKTLRKLYLQNRHVRGPHQTTLDVLVEYFRTNPVEQHAEQAA